MIRLNASPNMSFSASVILRSSSEPVSSCMAGRAFVKLVLIGGSDEDLDLVGGARLKLALIGSSDDDELAPVEDCRCGDENVC